MKAFTTFRVGQQRLNAFGRGQRIGALKVVRRFDDDFALRSGQLADHFGDAAERHGENDHLTKTDRFRLRSTLRADGLGSDLRFARVPRAEKDGMPGFDQALPNAARNSPGPDNSDLHPLLPCQSQQ